MSNHLLRGVLLIDEVNDLYATDTRYIVSLGCLLMAFDKTKRAVTVYVMIKSPQVLKAVDECLTGRSAFHKTFDFADAGPLHSNRLVTRQASMDLSVDFKFNNGLHPLGPEVFPAVCREQRALLQSLCATNNINKSNNSGDPMGSRRTPWWERLSAFYDLCFARGGRSEEEEESEWKVRVLLRSGGSAGCSAAEEEGKAFDVVLNVDKIDNPVAFIQPNWDVYCDETTLDVSRYRSLSALEHRIKRFAPK
ncbi:hypothetical protein ElyMa_003965500 [Elysia marginata]|uniref:Origin recognition complex subunit 1 n=1 Tax=Elysia marginata TaxID=1093978 RepID=A0AAV4FVR5_9GAST|nr:hypothetical protein ElyMa_003965500 [Elysia marginata]